MKILIIMILIVVQVSSMDWDYIRVDTSRQQREAMIARNSEYEFCMKSFVHHDEMIVAFPDIHVGSIRMADVYLDDKFMFSMDTDLFTYHGDEYAEMNFYSENTPIDGLLRSINTTKATTVRIVFKDIHKDIVRSLELPINDDFKFITESYSVTYDRYFRGYEK